MPVTLSDADIEEVRAALPELPDAKRQRFVTSYGISEYDAGVLTADRFLAEYFDKAAAKSTNPQLIANWIGSELLRELGNAKIAISDCKSSPDALAELVALIEKKTINGKIAKEVFAEMFANGGMPEAIVKEKGLVQVADSGAIAAIAAEAIAANPKQVEQYKAGNERVLQFFVGQVMKLSKGKANPQMAAEELKKLLS